LVVAGELVVSGGDAADVRPAGLCVWDRGGARTPTGIHTLTFISRAGLGERLYQHAHAIRSRIAVAPAPRGRLASADLFRQGDDDARGAAEVAEPEDALVLRHLAEEFGAAGA
jgi:hypothetical protein